MKWRTSPPPSQLKAMSKEEVIALDQGLFEYILFIRVFRGEGEWTYRGKGVQLGETETPIFWYRPEKSETYRVIYGDLHVDFQRHFTAVREGKCEEFTHIYFFKRLAPIAGSDFGLEIERVSRYCGAIEDFLNRFRRIAHKKAEKLQPVFKPRLFRRLSYTIIIFTRCKPNSAGIT